MTEQQFLEAVSDSRGVHPAKLIRLALEDLKKVEADPRYEVDMDDWHSGGSVTHPCAVCLAGAVMAKTMKLQYDKNLWPEDAALNGTTWALQALDELRRGNVRGGYSVLDRPFPGDGPEELKIFPYHISPERFCAEMEALADLIEQHDPID